MAEKTKIDENINNDSMQDEKRKKPKKDKKVKKSKSGKRKGKTLLIIFIVFFVVAGGFLTAVYFDLFKLRTVYLNNWIYSIPFLREYSTVDEPNLTYDELLAENNIVLSQNEMLDKEIINLENEIDQYKEENARLKEFEDEQLDFKAEKEEFDKMVASEEPYDYIQYYEEIYPSTAEEIYRQLKGEAVDSEKIDEYVARYKNMRPSDSAAIFEELMATDIDLVVLILENLDSDTAGEIISSMTPENGAIITKRMAPR